MTWDCHGSVFTWCLEQGCLTCTRSTAPERERKHPSHKTRFSDASTYDEICVNCGATDRVPGGWGDLAKPCPKGESEKK